VRNHLRSSSFNFHFFDFRTFSSNFAPQTPSNFEEDREGTAEKLSERPVLRVLMVRHAESLNNRLYRELCDTGRAKLWDEWRHPDPPLTEEGWQQAEQLATRLEKNNELYDFDRRGRTITRIYTSAMHRAMQTALPLHRYLRIPTEVWPDIHETGGIFHIKHGILRGYTWNQIGVEFAGFKVPRQIGDRGWWRGGSETYSEMVERANSTKRSLLDMTAELEEDATIVLVSHGSFLSALLRSLTQANCAFALVNTAVTCVDIEVDPATENDDNDLARVRLHYVNCLDRPKLHA